MRSGKDLFRQFKIAGTCLLLGLMLCAWQPLLRAQDHSAHEGHDGQGAHAGQPGQMSNDMPGMDMSSTGPDEEAWMHTPEKLAADKRESEFNHHLAGFFFVLAGIFILAEPWLRVRWPKVRYAWPVCFLLAGIFVLVYSDTELWPFGPQSWVYGLSHHMEVRQHKSFALILLAVGVIEFLRARGTLKAAWAGWVFPIVAITGSIILLFHEHRGGMFGAGHMERMVRIQTEHHSYTAAGFVIGLTKGLSEIKTSWQPVFSKLWPSIMIVLGVMLMFYVE
jgi:putative copper resistance protein D